MTLDKILARYESTPFGVAASGDVITHAGYDQGKFRAWTTRIAPPADAKKSQPARIRLTVEFAADKPDDSKVVFANTYPSTFSVEQKFEKAETPLAAPARYTATLYERVKIPPGERTIQVRFGFQSTKEGAPKPKFTKRFDVVLRTPKRTPSAADPTTKGVALIGGTLDLKLGHLCDQQGCVQHFHQSLQKFDGLAAARPHPSLDKPRATLYLRDGQPIDVWAVRQRLRQQSIEVTGLVPRDVGPYRLRVELPTWKITAKEPTDIVRSIESCERLLEIAKKLDWVKSASLLGAGIAIEPDKSNVDLIALVDAITTAGIAPSALWLVPEGVAMPKATPPVMIELVSAQKSTVSQSHPVIEIDLGPSSDIRTELASLLHRQKWASESSVFDNDITRLRASLGDRNYANLMPLLAGIDSLGRTPSAIRLSNFGDIRVQLGFDHICGDIVYSKPPRRKKADSKKDDKPKAPFVPQPRSLATTSNGRKAIRSAIESVSWVKNALFYDYHTRFEFAGAPTKITFALQATGDDVVRLDELITALRKAGFPPKSLTVSRRFPGIPFGKPLPENLELTTLEGKTRTLGSFAQAKRPLVVAFVQLNTKTRSKYHKYKAKPEYYHRFGKTIEKFGDRVDFVAISSNKHDTFGEAVKFWEQTGLTIPLLHDADRRCGDAFNVQITPPPHIFVFDSERRLRYAGDAHDNWEKPEAKYEDYLANALDKVFANKFLKNGAVFYNKSPCNCSHPKCKCPKCGCGSSCRCAIKHCGVGF